MPQAPLNLMDQINATFAAISVAAQWAQHGLEKKKN